MHLNIHSIERHIEELKVVLELLDFKFDILCFSESKIVDGETPKINPVGMPTKATRGGVLMYIKNGINFIPRNDLEIEKDKKLESCFVEILNNNHQNSIVGVVYRHPTMDQKEFITNYLNPLTQRLSKEKNPYIFQAIGTLIY